MPEIRGPRLRVKEGAAAPEGKGATSAPNKAAQKKKAKGNRGKAKRKPGKKKQRLGGKEKEKGPIAKLKRMIVGLMRLSNLPWKRCGAITEMMGFENRDLVVFKEAYEDIDLDLVGEIDYDEFIEFIKDTRSPYTMRFSPSSILRERAFTASSNSFRLFPRTRCTVEDILRFAHHI